MVGWAGICTAILPLLPWLAPGSETDPQEFVLSCLDLGTTASEDLCGEGARYSGRLSEAL